VPTDVVDRRAELRADCAQCVGLCCVALPFVRSADFAMDKPAGMPCRHLAGDDRCAIHDRLRSAGFPGCDVFDCFGAGQQVVQITFGGRSWRNGPAVAVPMFGAFATLRAVHEMRWHLADAADRELPDHLAGEVDRRTRQLAGLSSADETGLEAVDVGALRTEVGDLLGRVSASVRQDLGGPDLSGRDLAVRVFRDHPLRGADLRGSLLIAADLRGTDLREADLLGADLRGADLGGADLTGALFVTTPQLAGAHGDQATRIPRPVRRPSHWSVSSDDPREP
jgi:uncharacterized protein YjbI with pentapeptide repeats